MTIPSRTSLLTLSLCLAACSSPPPPAANIDTPPAWQGPATAQPLPDSQWWRAFASTELDRLVERARLNSHDLAAAAARGRHAQASDRTSGRSGKGDKLRGVHDGLTITLKINKML